MKPTAKNIEIATIGDYVIDIENTSALEPVFDFTVLSIDYYLDTLIGFWSAFPEHLPVRQKEELPF